MRMSRLFSQTLREAPSEAEIPSHQLLLRAGFIRQLAAGIFTYLPLAKRSLTKIENILRQEIEKIGGQEISMPVVHPAELWQESGRWHQIDAEMGRFQDRAGRDMVLAMTHEEVAADLARREIRSYRQLPVLLFHIQTKWRDDPRPRAGLIRTRELTMKDSYSLDCDAGGLDQQYRAHYQAYFRIFQRFKLPVIAVRSDVGMMGGQIAHEFMYLTPHGEDTLLVCDQCGFAANRQVASFFKPFPVEEQILPLEKVFTPECKTIESLANFLKVPKSKTAKAVFLVASITDGAKVKEQFVFVVLRGDMDVNETKLANAISARALRPATEAEILAAGATPGYASPIGLRNCLVVVDDLIPASQNLVAGANEAGFHLKNVNYGRDFTANLVVDIAAAQDGDLCANCAAHGRSSPLKAVRGVEVGNIFKLGTRYSQSMGCTYLDQDGQEKPIWMGSYGIGTGRLLACIAEHHHDDHGLRWPISVAPYEVHLVSLPGKGNSEELLRTADALYQELTAAGVEVLFDDRMESPGVKFNDADLIGVPIRLTISPRSMQAGGVELKRRDQKEQAILPYDQLLGRVQAEIRSLWEEIDQGVKPVQLPG